MDAKQSGPRLPGEADIAFEVLVEAAADLVEPKYTQGRPVSLTVLMATVSP